MTKIKKLNKKLLLVTLTILLVIGGASYLLLKKNNNNSQQTAQSSATEEALNLNPPTAEDAQQVDENKQRIINEQENAATQPPPPAGTKKNVTPNISFAEQNGSTIEVGSFVSGIFENGGTCTAKFSRGSLSVAKTVAATPEGNSVYCPLFSVPTSEFSQKGEWSVVVSYSSAAASGSSEARKFEVK